MSLFKVMDIAGSALAAQFLSLHLAAGNMANADNVSSGIDTTYHARRPVFAAMLDDTSIGFSDESVGLGMEIRDIVASPAPLRLEYRPEHPLADANGYIHMSSVEMIEEMANMISTSRSYQISVEVANTSMQMVLRTLALGS